ncbi:MAG: LON peptidase substrate-binding domain-containing protein, partial [Oscillospiraceae bacterium]|nr:LON peptidase substrate-binding domain-containing protein [Oscillospiraceae bacterium]
MKKQMIQENLMKLPAMALRGVVIFPGEPTHFDVGREKSVLALREAVEGDRKIFLVTQKDITIDEPGIGDLYQIGVIASVEQMLKGADNTIRVLVTGLVKARLCDILDEGCTMAVVAPIDEAAAKPLREEKEIALLRSVKDGFSHFASAFNQTPKEIEQAVAESEKLSDLIGMIISQIPFAYTDKQAILEETSLEKRAKKLTLILEREARIFTYENEIYNQVRANIDERQREIFLREQMHVLSEQLGEGDEDAEVAEYERRIRAIRNMPDETRSKLLKETERLNRLPVMSQEAAVITTYLDTCLELPWDTATKDKLDLKKARAKLDRDHYGMTKVKERILEALAVRQLSPELRGQIICLVGPPGVGKTSVARSVAEAMGRKYVRISLGGVRDESDIRGHRKTYIGSMPGRIITALTQAKSRNPLMLLDEIDKMGNDFKGDPSSAMLEVLDSEQNIAFRDHYVEVPFDLSEVLFITTANTLDT